MILRSIPTRFLRQLLVVLTLALVGVIGSPGTAGAFTFLPKTDYPTGARPISVAIGDVNGDGKLDLAVANFSGNTVSILLGTGTGGFGAKTDFAVGVQPSSVAIGDVNGDGKPDLAVANYYLSTVSILLGTGAGGFLPKTDFAVGGPPLSVAIGDFNGDGKPDLAVAGNGVSILLGTGTGSFGAKTDFATGGADTSVAIGDFNGDGKLDLAVANVLNPGFGSVSILLGTGTGSFGANTDFATGANPRSVAIGDFNGDGKPDLAVANAGGNTVSILLGTGTGSFGAKTDFATGGGPMSVAIGDVNGDGQLDLATANGGGLDNTASILLQPTPPCATPPSGMVAWWPLDETSGATSVRDIWGGNNGTPLPGPIGPIGPPANGPAPGSLAPIAPPAAVGGSLYFYSQAKRFVQVPNVSSLNFGAGDFTIDAWVYASQVGTDVVQPIVDKLQLAGNPVGGIGYRLFILNGQVHFVLLDGGTAVNTQAPITFGLWQHVAVVRKGGTPNTVEVYIDGVLRSTSTPSVSSLSNTGDLLIGGIVPGASGLPASFGYGAIAIDELEIFNTAVSQLDIQSIHNAGSAGKCRVSAPWLRDHKADANGDGYSAADESTIVNCGAASCAGIVTFGTAETGTCKDAGRDCGVPNPPIDESGPARIAPPPAGGYGCSVTLDTVGPKTTRKLAQSDIDLDGVVSILDLVKVAGWFGNTINPSPADPRWEGDMDGDGVISILDLVAMASNFGRSVANNCKVE